MRNGLPPAPALVTLLFFFANFLIPHFFVRFQGFFSTGISDAFGPLSPSPIQAFLSPRSCHFFLLPFNLLHYTIPQGGGGQVCGSHAISPPAVTRQPLIPRFPATRGKNEKNTVPAFTKPKFLFYGGDYLPFPQLPHRKFLTRFISVTKSSIWPSRISYHPDKAGLPLRGRGWPSHPCDGWVSTPGIYHTKFVTSPNLFLQPVPVPGPGP